MSEETGGLSGDEPLKNQSPPPAEWEDISEKFRALEGALNSFFKEREEPIEGLLVALIAKEHVVLLGPAGTGKTLLTRSLAEAFDLKYFWTQLYPFSKEGDIFGSLDLQEFIEHHVERKRIQNMMPTAEYAHIDEIFKGNSAILKGLLTMLQERIFFNPDPIPVPLISCVGTSNEIPKQEDLDSLYDRFRIRFVCPYIQDPQNFLEMIMDPREKPEVPCLLYTSPSPRDRG